MANFTIRFIQQSKHFYQHKAKINRVVAIKAVALKVARASL